MSTSYLQYKSRLVAYAWKSQLPPHFCTRSVIPGAERVAERSKPEEHIEATDTAGEVAPHVQDDFDMDDSELKNLDIKDQPENQVCMFGTRRELPS